MTITLDYKDFPDLASELENSSPGATISANIVMQLNSADAGSATFSIDSLQVRDSKEKPESEDAYAASQEEPKSAVALIFGKPKKKKNKEEE